MSIPWFRISMFGRLRASSLVLVIGLLLTASFGPSQRTIAQDTASTEEGHPLVGTWIIHPDDDWLAMVSLTSDGVAILTDSAGPTGLGSWSATSPTGGNITFVIFIAHEEFDVTGTNIIRIALEYDEANDTASGSFTVTGATYDGDLFYSDEGTVTATRVPVEGPEMGGNVIPALVTEAPEATPTA